MPPPRKSGQNQMMDEKRSTFDLEALFRLAVQPQPERVVSTLPFSRTRTLLPDGGTITKDQFSDAEGACCLFVRVSEGPECVARIVVDGEHRLQSCPAGGWLLRSNQIGVPSYWIPQQPWLRTFDAQGRILLEEPAPIVGLAISTAASGLSVRIKEGMQLDLVFWRLPERTEQLCSELESLMNLECQKTYLWSSKTGYQSPADLYLYLVNGHVYQNARAVPRKWKFCCELDAFELYVWLSGLGLATGKLIYELLRRQIVLSVIARQSGDGGWYHGEWTDEKESHYRFHCGALLLLENALDEWDDHALRIALEKGVAFVASHTDETALGRWFLHDSLEESVEALNAMLRQTGSLIKGFGAWKPSRILGKSVTNKMILNTHVDTTVAVQRYIDATGDVRWEQHVASARRATKSLLRLRPAEAVYRAIYAPVGLTLLPAPEAKALPLPLRAVKKVTLRYLLPNLYRLKRIWPRIVMPGGLIERHLSPLHFDTKYHAVNVLDLVRLWRRFPEDELGDVLREGIEFVMRDGKRILRSWAESKPRQFAAVVFAEALYHLCMCKPDAIYRQYLAEVLTLIDGFGLGMPPSLLGGNAEVTRRARQIPCPSPASGQLRVANLSTVDRTELLAVNPTDRPVQLRWEGGRDVGLVWTAYPATPATGTGGEPSVPARGWLWGKESCA
jgi:hypothetical protein